MTMDKSLRTRVGLARSRSVLNRAERIARLQQADKWKEGDSPVGLPKVRVYKLAMKKKKKKVRKVEKVSMVVGFSGCGKVEFLIVLMIIVFPLNLFG